MRQRKSAKVYIFLTGCVFGSVCATKIELHLFHAHSLYTQFCRLQFAFQICEFYCVLVYSGLAFSHF